MNDLHIGNALQFGLFNNCTFIFFFLIVAIHRISCNFFNYIVKPGVLLKSKINTPHQKISSPNKIHYLTRIWFPLSATWEETINDFFI